MDFTAFDPKTMDEYSREAQQKWGETAAWREYEGKRKGRSDRREQEIAAGLMERLWAFAALRESPADCPQAREAVEALRDYITEHYYTCTPEILRGLGQMYAAGGSMTDTIDAHCGKGTAACAAAAIAAYGQK